MKTLFLSILFSLIAVVISHIIMLPWINDLKLVFGGYLTYIILSGITFIPCFAMFFVNLTLLATQKTPSKLIEYPKLSILIAAYNEEDNIIDTIKSIINQGYPNHLDIIVSDDGSKDCTVYNANKYINSYRGKHTIRLLTHEKNNGKSYVLNDALDAANTELIVTIDSDTILHRNALVNIVDKMLSDDYAAVAGTIRANNTKTNMMTRIQYWDYMLGIAAVKQAQGIYNSTLVAQGAFSCYRRYAVYETGWSHTIGEDIVLSWDMLNRGLKIGHANNAIVFTNVPESYKNFYKQRKRWSIGLIEAFRRNGSLLFKMKKGLPFIWYNLLFPYIDISYVLFFIPAVIAATFFEYYLMAGMLTILLMPLGITMGLIIIYIQSKVNKKTGLKYTGDFVSFLLYVCFYQTLQVPATISGYISEILNMEKSWGTR